MTEYLTVAEVLTMHHELIERFGGAHGVRDMGAVEAAVFRPQTGYYEDIIQEAAALMESLAINHPFIDGNKRIAFAAADVFLRINGMQIVADSMKFYQEMISLFDNQKFELKNLDVLVRKFILT